MILKKELLIVLTISVILLSRLAFAADGTDGIILSAQMTSPVTKIHKEVGADVQKGDVLISLSCDVHKARYEGALSGYEMRKENYTNKVLLRTMDAASDLEVSTARQKMNKAEARVKEHKAFMNHCVIRAPFDGTIEAIMFKIHETAQAGQPAVELSAR